MNKSLYKILAIIFGLISFGTMSESYRIMTSNAPDIVPERGFLTIMSLAIFGLMIFLTRHFWMKSK